MPLTAHIQPVSAIEASASEHPDDVSTINIRINLDNETAADVAQPDHINVLVRSPGPNFSTAPAADQASIKKGLLTLAPKSITPVSGQNSWALKFLTERPAGTDGRVVESVFRASRLGTSTSNGNIGSHTGLEFTLRDVQVVDSEGNTDLVIEQFDTAAATAATTTFTLNKVFPTLGIERFVANPAVIQVGLPVTLSWVTKGATEIHLEGLAPADQTNFDSRFASATGANLHATSFTVTPGTGTTYTLRAKNGTAEAMQQVTVVVTNRSTAQDLTVTGNLTVLTEATIKNAQIPSLTAVDATVLRTLGVGTDATVSGKLTAGTASITGDLTAANIVQSTRLLGISARVLSTAPPPAGAAPQFNVKTDPFRSSRRSLLIFVTGTINVSENINAAATAGRIFVEVFVANANEPELDRAFSSREWQLDAKPGIQALPGTLLAVSAGSAGVQDLAVFMQIRPVGADPLGFSAHVLELPIDFIK